MQTRRATTKTLLKETCQLDDTPDEDAGASSSDKENTLNAASRPCRAGQKSKSKAKGDAKKKPAKRQKRTEMTSPLAVASPETPPSFTFKATKTAFRQRKQRKQERQREQDEKNKKRIKDLVAYFKNLDEQKLETA